MIITVTYILACSVSFAAGIWLGYQHGWLRGNAAGYEYWEGKIQSALKEQQL